MKVLAIDPGPETSGVLFWDGRKADFASQEPNADVLKLLEAPPVLDLEFIAIEMVACYGMAVGKEVFETCLWIGRFMERACRPVRLVYRKDVKMHLCQSMRAKDANIRQSIIDRFGPIGTKREPGPLYGVKGHLWAALAVAIYASEVHT